MTSPRPDIKSNQSPPPGLHTSRRTVDFSGASPRPASSPRADSPLSYSQSPRLREALTQSQSRSRSRLSLLASHSWTSFRRSHIPGQIAFIPRDVLVYLIAFLEPEVLLALSFTSRRYNEIFNPSKYRDLFTKRTVEVLEQPKVWDIIIKGCLPNGELYGDYQLFSVERSRYPDLTPGRKHGADAEEVVEIAEGSGSLREETTYLDGVKDGVEVHWFDELRDKQNYLCIWNNGKKHGKEKSFHINGVKSAVCEWKNGVKHGRDRQWYSNGQLKETSNWKEGKKHGEQHFWFVNGQKNMSFNWIEGEPEKREMWSVHGKPVDWRKQYSRTKSHNQDEAESLSFRGARSQ